MTGWRCNYWEWRGNCTWWWWWTCQRT